MIEEAESHGSMSQVDEVGQGEYLLILVESWPYNKQWKKVKSVHTVPSEPEESVTGPFEQQAVEEGKI